MRVQVGQVVSWDGVGSIGACGSAWEPRRASPMVALRATGCGQNGETAKMVVLGSTVELEAHLWCVGEPKLMFFHVV